MKKQANKTKHWLFTINNWTMDDVEKIADAKERFGYIVYGKEVGEDGTPHLQGYIVMLNRQRLTAMKKILPRAHLEAKSRNSTFAECITYCKKDGNFLEQGTAPITQSVRNKRTWEDAFALAKTGDFEKIPKNMLVRYYHAFKRIHTDNPPEVKDLKQKQNYWIVAPSQHGKSRYARERWPDFYDKGPNKWWTGYKGQQTILLDDFGPKQCKYIAWYMKRWADLYSFPMETKGGGHQIRPQHIVVTSQYTIERCFEDDEEIAAIKNRFIVINLVHWKKRIKTAFKL